MKKGLVLEGGAMRGLFTAGICDIMMEHDIWPDGIVGVSAGAAFGCNYKSRQPGRAIRYNMRFAHDKRYSGLWSLLRTGNYFNAEFDYHIVPTYYDPFDANAFEQNPMEFYVVCTDTDSGAPIYQKLSKCNAETLDWIRASASMPLASKVINMGQTLHLLDGGITDSIPLRFFEQNGYKRNVVILTQPEGYTKRPNPLMPLMRIALHRYPNTVQALAARHIMYNRQLDYVREAEAEGRCMVIRPKQNIPIGHISHNPKQMHLVYEMGRETGKEYINDIKQFYTCE